MEAALEIVEVDLSSKKVDLLEGQAHGCNEYYIDVLSQPAVLSLVGSIVACPDAGSMSFSEVEQHPQTILEAAHS